MYLDHFGLYTAPFSLVPHLRFVFLSHTFEETMAHLVYGLEGGEDIILITGEIGSGKTLALHYLSSNVKGHYQIAVVNTTQVNFNELMKLLLSDMGVKVASRADRADLLNALGQVLEALRNDGKRLLLIIDEAQNLDKDTLEGVRLLTNLGPTEEQWLQLILAGQPGLRSKIDQPELAQVRQRIRVHYHLETLTEKETGEYLAHRLKVAGCERAVFSPETVALIHRRSQGIPRLVNILADKALLAAYVDGDQKIKAEHIPDEPLPRSPKDDMERAQRAARSSEEIRPLRAPGTLPPQRPAAAPVRESRGPTWGMLFGILVSVAAVAALLVWLWPRLTLEQSSTQEAGSSGSLQETASRTALRPATTKPETLAVEPVTISADTTPAGPSPITQDVVTARNDDIRGNEEAAASEQSTLPETPEVAVSEELEPDVVTELKGPCVHVASFLDYYRAEIMRNRLRRVSDRTAILKLKVGGKTWYRIYSGPWDTMEQAQTVEARIRNYGISDWTLLMVL